MVDGKRIVREGYDRVAEAYLAARRILPAEQALLDDFAARLPAGAAVLDAGCGAGEPVARWLAERFSVTGVDISARQLALARERVPGAQFIQGDLSEIDLPAGVFAGIVSLYALIHVPRDLHAAVLARFRAWLAPGGWLLLATGAGECDDDIEEDWLGGGAPMYWSHYGREANLALLRAVGFTVVREELVVEAAEYGGGAHLFALAQAPV